MIFLIHQFVVVQVIGDDGTPKYKVAIFTSRSQTNDKVHSLIFSFFEIKICFGFCLLSYTDAVKNILSPLKIETN